MKRCQRDYKESDEEATIRRREAIVDRALLYARLLSILDERSKADHGCKANVVRGDQRVGSEAEEEHQAGPPHDGQPSELLTSEANATY